MKKLTQILLLILSPLFSVAQDSLYTISISDQSFSINLIEEDGIYVNKDITTEVFVDTSSISRFNYRSYLFPVDYDSSGEKILGAKNIEVYKISICNDSLNTRNLQLQDSRLVLIQEAKDSSGAWRPIEYFIHSTCGMSYTNIEIPHNYCLDGLIAKYGGDFKTEFRVKLLFNGQILYSNVFEGMINMSQFESKDSHPDRSF